MANRNPDVENLRKMVEPLLAELRSKQPTEQRPMFDASMENIPLAAGCTVESLVLGGVPAERITPAGAVAGKVLLYLHGGGYVVGSIKSYRHFVSRLAVSARITACHLDYRLAPEHPYPAALEDATGAYRQLLAMGMAPQDILVGGDSAGGNLAAALVLKLRESGLPQPTGLYLLSPWLDMTTTGPSYDEIGARDPICSREAIKAYAAAFLGGRRDDQFTSPVRANLSGLAPMLIQVGTEEVLLSDSLTFAGRAALAGVDVTLRVWAEMPHVWPVFHPFIRAGLPAIEEVGQWMREHLVPARRQAA
jgi:acetyl esterase/lipase